MVTETARRCACGCGAEVVPQDRRRGPEKIYASDRCLQRARGRVQRATTCDECGKTFLTKKPRQRRHVACQKARSHRLSLANAAAYRRRHPERRRASKQAWLARPENRARSNRARRRRYWRDPEKSRARLRAEWDGRRQRWKLARGRVCSSCKATDHERSFRRVDRCNACFLRGEKNGYDAQGRARYQGVTLPFGCENGRDLLLSLWELATREWPDEARVGRGRVRLTSAQVAPFVGIAPDSVERRLLPRVRRLARRFGFWGVTGKRSRRKNEAWWIELDVLRVREATRRVLDRIARAEPDEEAA